MRLLRPLLALALAVSLVTAVGCSSRPNWAPPRTGGSSEATSTPPSVELTTDAPAITRGPYTFSIASVSLMSSGVNDAGGPPPHGMFKRGRAAPGYRYVVVDVKIVGRGVEPLRMYWYAGHPRLIVDGSRESSLVVGGTSSRGYGGPLIDRSIFEVPLNAESMVLVFPAKVAGGPLTFKLE